MKNILIVFTGGTIGSRTDGHSIDVHHDMGYELIRKYNEQYGEQVSFKVIQPFTILSENMLPQDWDELCRAIEAALDSQFSGIDFNGIIITHGTDTLAYTAAAVSYRFARSSIPIVLTASNYPLDHPASEGLRNFAACVTFILEDPVPGIFVIFEDYKGRMNVHLASRIRQSESFTDQYSSIYGQPFGEIREGRLSLHSSPVYPDIDQLRDTSRRTDIGTSCCFAGDILYVKPYPGFRYTFLELSNKRPQAVLVELYHSATTGMRFSDEEDSLQTFIHQCQKDRIPVYIAPVKSITGSLYATSHELLQLGVIPLINISIEAALVKLMLAYGTFRNQQEIEKFLATNIFFEIVENPETTYGGNRKGEWKDQTDE